MNRATWRDVVVDVFTITLMFGAVLVKLWTMQGAAPWMVAVAAGRWGASTLSKYATAKASLAKPRSVPPPALSAPPEVEAQVLDLPPPSSRPLPSSGIVLVLLAIGTALLTLWGHDRHGA